MIQVQAEESSDAKWKRWRQRASEALGQLIQRVAAGEGPTIDDAVYKAAKEFLWDLFHGKCAYCEARLEGNQPGDVEHFRPKKRVTDDHGKPVVHSETGEVHPGYYWLAYDWLNLLPSCEACNRPSTGKGGEKLGKGNRFPVRGFRGFKPGEQLREEPLLLHPFVDDPKGHLLFDETGIVGGITEEGKKTIEILGLNRDGLVDERRSAIQNVKGLLVRVTSALIDDNKGTAGTLTAELEQYKKGTKPYSAVGRMVITKKRQEILASI